MKGFIVMACCLLGALRAHTTRGHGRPLSAAAYGLGKGVSGRHRGERRTLFVGPIRAARAAKRPLNGRPVSALPPAWATSTSSSRSSSSTQGSGQTDGGVVGVPQVSDLKRLSDYFFRAGKDNSTVYFYAQSDYGSVWEAVEAELRPMTNVTGVTSERAQRLHEIGAVYRLGDKFRRTTEPGQGGPVSKGEGFKVYLFPRTFPGCYVEDYEERVAYEDDDFLVVEKPPGCPCSPHVSNKIDCLDITLGASLRKPGLIRLNRLDTVTSGLVTIGKSAKGATAFQEELRRQRIHKVYRALLEGPVPVGPLLHFMASDILHRRPAPRAISTVNHPGWKNADSSILSCRALSVHELTLDEAEAAGKEVLYEVEVELITGRTHQLRAQFAAMHAPIVGDDMYKPMAGYLFDDLEDPRIHELYPICLEPKGRHGVALQCSRLRYLHLDVTARDPWWRRREKAERQE